VVPNYTLTGTLLAIGVSAASLTVAQQSDGIRERVKANYRLYRPDGAGPFPTVIAVPGCSGVSFVESGGSSGEGSRVDDLFRQHYPRMSERFVKKGYAVILLDYLGAHGVDSACGGEVSVREVGEYVTATADFAKSLEVVDDSRITLVGWSRGGGGVLDALATVSQSDEPSFSSVVAFYPNCHESRPWVSRIPTLLLLGAIDDIDPPEMCETVVANLADPSSVRVHKYEGARHGFDLSEAPPVMELGNGRSIGFNSEASTQAWDAADAHLRSYP
jgi:dienelactone hydrolase